MTTAGRGGIDGRPRMLPSVALAAPDQPVPVGAFLAPLRLGWLAILVGAAAGLIGGLVLSALQAPVYEAKALIQIQGLNSDFLNARSVDPSMADPEIGSYLQTQMKLLESDLMIDRAVTALGVDKRPEFQSDGPPASAEAVLGRKTEPPRGRQRVLEQAADSLRVRSLGLSRLLEVSYFSSDPDFASRFVNTLASEFMRYSVENRIESTRTVAQQLGQQLQDLKNSLEKSENELQSYARSAGLVFTGERDSAAQGKLKQLQDALLKAQEARVQEQTRYERVLATPPDALPEVLDDATLRGYHTKLTDLRQEAADVATVLKPAHYRVKQLQAQIETFEAAIATHRANIVRRLKAQYETAVQRENMLAQYHSQQTGRVSEEAARAVRYDILKREVETNRQMYDAMLQRVKEAGIASAVRAAHLRIVSPARVPEIPVRPKPPIYAMAGLLAGALAGVVFAFVRPSRAAVIHGPGDTSVYLSVPELGLIPDAGKYPESLRNGAGRNGELPDIVQLVSWHHPYSRLAEAFRGAAASVLFCTPASTHRVVVVTSACPGEGKTTVAANLGVMLAAAGHSVLLVDGDMRRPSLHQVFGVENAQGLSELLSEPDGDDTLLPFQLGFWTEIPGLSVLPSGAKPADAGSLLCCPRMPQIIERLRHSFQIVLIDTPPLALSDARVFGRLSDGVVMVVRSGRTPAEEASSALLRLAEDGTRILGTIVNRWDPKRSSSGAYGSYMQKMPDTYFKV